MSNDYKLYDGRKVEVKPSAILDLIVDGEYWGGFPDEHAAMEFYEHRVKPQLDKKEEDEIFGAGGDPCNWWLK